MAKRYRAGELYNGGGNPAVYLASDYDTMTADRDQISLTLDVAKADRDKWFNRAKALEAALAKANALGHQNVKPDFAAETGAKSGLAESPDGTELGIWKQGFPE